MGKFQVGLNIIYFDQFRMTQECTSMRNALIKFAKVWAGLILVNQYQN